MHIFQYKTRSFFFIRTWIILSETNQNLFFSAFAVRARHELIQGAIGAYPEENYAYWLVTTLLWALPLTIFLAALVDLALVLIFMNKAHPWIGILTVEEANEEAKEEEGSMLEENNEDEISP